MSSPIKINRKVNNTNASPYASLSNKSPMSGFIASPLVGSWRQRVGQSPMLNRSSPMINRQQCHSDDEDDINNNNNNKYSLSPPMKAKSYSNNNNNNKNNEDDEDENKELLIQSEKKSSYGLEGYLKGQIGNVIKMAVWWTVFGALSFALFDGNSLAIGGMRVSFNLAMLLFSPLAGAIADHASVRNVLINTTLMRGLIYVVLLPGMWILLESEWLGWSTSSHLKHIFFAIFLLLVFIDGISVAFANIVDIDSGGTDLVGAQCNTEVDDKIRNRFNSLHEAFFDGAMIIFSPLVAAISYVATEQWHHKDRVSMLFSLSGLFLLTTIYSFYFYNKSLPKIKTNSNETTSILPSKNEISEIIKTIIEGFWIAWKIKAIRWRLIFLALETSVEDAFVSLLIVEFALDGYYNNSNYARGNLLANAIVAVGKIGGVMASIYMHKNWKAPEDNSVENTRRAFRPLFYYVFLGAIFALLVPIGNHLTTSEDTRTLGLILVFISSFFFFLFSTAPKIGFATLLQGLVVETGSPGRVFGFVASFITFTDSFVLMIMSIVFTFVSVQNGLWITCGFIALHGLLELTLGPYLILESAHQVAQSKSLNGNGTEVANYSKLEDDEQQV